MQNYKSTMQLICLERNIVIQVKHYAEYRIYLTISRAIFTQIKTEVN